MQCKLNNRQFCGFDKGLHSVIVRYTEILVFNVEFSECCDSIVENDLILTLRHFDCKKALSKTVLIKDHLSTTTTMEETLLIYVVFFRAGCKGQEMDL